MSHTIIAMMSCSVYTCWSCGQLLETERGVMYMNAMQSGLNRHWMEVYSCTAFKVLGLSWYHLSTVTAHLWDNGSRNGIGVEATLYWL